MNLIFIEQKHINTQYTLFDYDTLKQCNECIDQNAEAVTNKAEHRISLTPV